MAIDITTIGIEYDTSGLIAGTNAQNQTTASANQLGNAVSGTERKFGSFAKTIAIAATAMAAIGSIALAKQFIEIGDAVTLMDARLKLAVGSSQDFAKAQKDIYAISQANNVGLQETTALYTKLYDPVKRLGGSTKEATAIVDAFATSLRVGGAGAQEAASATLQFAQAMGSGKLQGDEFRSMAEASPRFMKALAEGMGVPIEKLKAMGSEGKLTADVVGNALIKSLDKLKQEALSLPDTVGGAVTRFKNDIIVAVGEINNSEGFSMGFAGMIEGARQLIPTIKDELAGALGKVSEWFSWIKEEVISIWNNVKGLLGEVSELSKPMIEITAIIAGWIVNTGVFSNSIVAIRILIAGVYDGFTIIGAALAGIGSKIMQFVLSPLTFVLEKSAQIAGVFNEDLANKIRGVNKNISDFTGAGSEYGSSVVDAFGRGDTALARLNKSLEDGNSKTKEVTKSVIDASGGYGKLAGSVSDTEKKIKGLTIAEEALHTARKQGTKIDLEMAKDFDKSMEQFAKDQLKRTHEVTKAITDNILDQGKNYLSLKNKIDQYTDSLNESNDLSKLEMSLIGSSNSERQIAIEQYKIALTLKKQLAEIDEKNLSQGEKNILVQEAQTAANLAKSQVELKVQQTEWTSFFADIYTGLSDSLYRSFESGKGFAKTFIDSLKNLFKTNVIKIAVQAVMGGGLSLSGLANAATGAGSAASSIGGLASLVSGAGSLFGSTGFMASLAGGLNGAGVGSGLTSSLGLTIGNSVSSVLGSSVSGAISSGISAASSVLAAVPVWGWAALAGGALLSKFGGGGDRVTGAQNVSGTLGTNDISRNVDFTKSGGLFGKSDSGTWNYNLGTSAAIASNGRSYTDTASQSSDTAMLQTINSTYAALVDAGKGFAVSLGMSADVVTSTTDKINFAIGKTQAETDAAMQAAFGQVADNIAQRIIPSILSMTKEGESASQALQRVATGFSSANMIFGDIGLKLFEMNDAGLKASSVFVDLVGGLDGLQSVTQSYYDTYFTESEKNAKILEAVTSEFAKQNLILPDSISGYRALVEEISKTGTPEQLAALLNMNQAFASVVPKEVVAQVEEVKELFVNIAEANAATPVSRLVAEIDKLQVSADNTSAILAQRTSLQDQLDELTMTELQLLEKKRNSYYAENQGLFDQVQSAILNKKAQDELNKSTQERLNTLSKEKSAIDLLNESIDKNILSMSSIFNELANNVTNAGKKSNEVFKNLTSEVEKLLLGSSSGLGEQEKLAFAKSQLSTVSRDQLPDAVNAYLSLLKESGVSQESYTREFSSLINSMSDVNGTAKAAFDDRIKAENLAADANAKALAESYIPFMDIVRQQAETQKRDAEITQRYLEPQGNLTLQQRVDRQQFLTDNPISTQTEADREVNRKVLETLQKLLAASERTANATNDMASGQAVITTQVN